MRPPCTIPRTFIKTQSSQTNSEFNTVSTTSLLGNLSGLCPNHSLCDFKVSIYPWGVVSGTGASLLGDHCDSKHSLQAWSDVQHSGHYQLTGRKQAVMVFAVCPYTIGVCIKNVLGFSAILPVKHTPLVSLSLQLQISAAPQRRPVQCVRD